MVSENGNRYESRKKIENDDYYSIVSFSLILQAFPTMVFSPSVSPPEDLGPVIWKREN